MILDEKIMVNVAGKTKQHYIDFGYEIPTYINDKGQSYVKKGTMIEVVKVLDLPKNSHIKINVSCDNCGSVKQISYQSYITKFENILIEIISPHDRKEVLNV